MRYRRINLIGGPSTGKSTCGPELYSRLSKHFQGKSFEYIKEWIKLWACQKVEIKSFNQFYIFAKQLHPEDAFLSSGVDIVVSESPLWLVCYYCRLKGDHFFKELMSVAKQFEERYPSLCIFLDREGLKYQTEGRYQDEVTARKIDQEMENFLQEHDIPYKKIRTIDSESIFQYASNELS